MFNGRARGYVPRALDLLRIVRYTVPVSTPMKAKTLNGRI